MFAVSTFSFLFLSSSANFSASFTALSTSSSLKLVEAVIVILASFPVPLSNADQTIYQIEKTLSEVGDKATEEEKNEVKAKIEDLKKVKDGDDVEAIKAAIEAVNQSFYPIATKMYQQAEGQEGAGFDPNAAAGGAGAQSAPHDDNVVDADFKVDEDK